MKREMNLKSRFGIDICIDEIVYDTRDITSNNSLFFCINEASYNFVESAVEKGAVLIVSSKKLDNNIPHVVVDDVLESLSDTSAQFYDYPSKALDFIAITGTDGKTTTALIMQFLLRNLQGNCGYIGTNGVIYEGFSEKYFCTMPFPPLLHKSLLGMKNAKEKTVVIEATSQALALKRVENLSFKQLLFTNFSSDHLDFHLTLDNYLEAKLHSVDLLDKDGILFVNVDDPKSTEFINRSHDQVVYTYSVKTEADYYATNIEFYTNRIEFDINHNDKSYHAVAKLIGEFNVYNVLLAVASVHQYGFELEDIVNNLPLLENVEGRSMFIENDLGIDILIDFAHTSNGVSNILSFLRKTCDREGKRIISLMGVPGRRDATKRPLVGETLTKYSDYVYFTSDDPRDEDPNEIINQMTSGALHRNYDIVVDRKEAIRKMITNAKKGDVLVLLGKGAENKFAIGFEEIDYLEEDVVREVLKSL